MRKPDLSIILKKYGLLTVIELTEERNSYGRLLYKCQCECGGIRLATKSNLVRGEIKSCGCTNNKPKKNLIGQRFGKLVVLEYAKKREGPRRSRDYVCTCDCGNEAIVNTNSLTTGKTKSCGCLQKDFVKSLYVEGTAPCKIANRHPRKSNTSGTTGVWYDKARGKWQAEIMFQSKKFRLGRYFEKSEAIKARNSAEKEIFDNFLEWYAINYPKKWEELVDPNKKRRD